jgi:hypothetical protein
MQACLMCGSRGFLLAACLVFVVATVDAALAQAFGMTRSAPPAEVSGFGAWVLAKQGGFYRMLSSLIRAAKADGSAAYTLLGVSFLYGVSGAGGDHMITSLRVLVAVCATFVSVETCFADCSSLRVLAQQHALAATVSITLVSCSIVGQPVP